MDHLIKRRHSDHIKHRGMMVVISSPSGAGKTTITRQLLEQEKYLSISISATTRAPRPGEREGHDYYFKTKDEFEAMIRAGEFLEHAYVFGNYYGTPFAPVEKALQEGKDVLFDVDWQGAQQMLQKFPADVVSVFILPPSLEVLEERLHKRGQDSEEVIAQRMSKAISEISHWAEYKYVIVNDDLQKSIDDMRSILRSERLRRSRQIHLSEFIHDMIHPDGEQGLAI
jgi:guanylate kinase